MKPADLLIIFFALLAIACFVDTKLEGRPTRWLMFLALDLVNGFKAARRQRVMIAQAHATLARAISTRPKIVEVGSIEYTAAGVFVINPDWLFEHRPDWIRACAGEVGGVDIDGKWRLFGYTQKEFEEIHARRSEFNVNS